MLYYSIDQKISSLQLILRTQLQLTNAKGKYMKLYLIVWHSQNNRFACNQSVYYSKNEAKMFAEWENKKTNVIQKASSKFFNTKLSLSEPEKYYIKTIII